MNQNLPELSVWQARSTYAVLIAIVFSVLSQFGVQLPEGFGPEVVTEYLFQTATAVAVVWAWLERRSPNYSLVFWRSGD